MQGPRGINVPGGQPRPAASAVNHPRTEWTAWSESHVSQFEAQWEAERAAARRARQDAVRDSDDGPDFDERVRYLSRVMNAVEETIDPRWQQLFNSRERLHDVTYTRLCEIKGINLRTVSAQPEFPCPMTLLPSLRPTGPHGLFDRIHVFDWFFEDCLELCMPMTEMARAASEAAGWNVSMRTVRQRMDDQRIPRPWRANLPEYRERVDNLVRNTILSMEGEEVPFLEELEEQLSRERRFIPMKTLEESYMRVLQEFAEDE
ncbi:hypothetical protein JCM10908_000296 [Rhodotorula pacifica]|uniref:uncharacterized protein n=1 Tax=Rhodotorula pacifica TaxID=1495444 RepID=UPI00317B634A